MLVWGRTEDGVSWRSNILLYPQPRQWDFSVSTGTSLSLFLSSSRIMLGWPPLFLVKNEAAPPSAASLPPLPPLLIFIAISANGHTHGFFILGFFTLVQHLPREGSSHHRVFISLYRCRPLSVVKTSPPAHYPRGSGTLGWEGVRLERPFSYRQEGMVTRAALYGSLACQYAHQHLKYRWKRGDGVLVCRFMQILFIHQMSTWLSVPALVQPSGVLPAPQIVRFHMQKLLEIERCRLVQTSGLATRSGARMVCPAHLQFNPKWDFIVKLKTNVARLLLCNAKSARCLSFLRIRQCHEWKFLCVGRLLL